MAQNGPSHVEGPNQESGRDRQPTGTPERVKELSHEAKKDLHTPKDQPDRNQPEPNKDFPDNEEDSDMS